MSIVSSIKPETETTADDIKTQTRFNDRTWQSYIKEGFEDHVPRDVQARHDRLVNFLSQAGDRPIHRRVDTIWRIKSAETGFKEYLYYTETLTGTTWANAAISPNVDHEREGDWFKQLRTPVINEKKQVVEYERSGQTRMFLIPFTKKELDRIIDSSEGSDRESIKFYMRNPNGAQRSWFRYDQFLLPWADCMNMLLLPGGPQGFYAEKLMASLTGKIEG